MFRRLSTRSPRELGLMLARQITGARFVEIDSRNHLRLSHETAWIVPEAKLSFLPAITILPGDGTAQALEVSQSDGSTFSSGLAMRAFLLSWV